GIQAFSAQDCSDPTNVGGGVSLCQNTQFRLHRKSPTPRPIRQFGRRRRRGRNCGRPPASLRTSPGGTVRFRFFVLHDHVMVVLRPCEAKLSGLRCLTIIGTEGHVGKVVRVIGGGPSRARVAASTLRKAAVMAGIGQGRRSVEAGGWRGGKRARLLVSLRRWRGRGDWR